jgi:hypothetical protein
MTENHARGVPLSASGDVPATSHAEEAWAAYLAALATLCGNDRGPPPAGYATLENCR